MPLQEPPGSNWSVPSRFVVTVFVNSAPRASVPPMSAVTLLPRVNFSPGPVVSVQPDGTSKPTTGRGIGVAMVNSLPAVSACNVTMALDRTSLPIVCLGTFVTVALSRNRRTSSGAGEVRGSDQFPACCQSEWS